MIHEEVDTSLTNIAAKDYGLLECDTIHSGR
jgi:hypothetical protein